MVAGDLGFSGSLVVFNILFFIFNLNLFYSTALPHFIVFNFLAIYLAEAADVRLSERAAPLQPYSD